MSQHDMVLDNQAGASFRADANNALQALASNNSGSGAPPATYPYQFWADTNTGLLKMRNAANNAWVTIGLLGATNFGHILPGTIVYHAKSTAPSGYLKSNGAAVSRTTFADLFAEIGTAFGAGDGSTTFNLPELRGEFLRGWDDSRGVDASRAFGSAQLDALQNITGGMVARSGASGSGSIISASGAMSYSLQTGTAGVSTLIASGGGANADVVNFNAANVARTATETRARNIALLACIKI